jgi:hypothetical protein
MGGGPPGARSQAVDLNVFRSVKVGDFGSSVVWADDDALELASDNLRGKACSEDRCSCIGFGEALKVDDLQFALAA